MRTKIVILIFIVAFAGIATALVGSGTLKLPEKLTSTAAVASSEVNDILVNGERITAREINDAYESLPEESRADMTKKEIADSLVSSKLLEQQASRKGIIISDDEIEEYITQAMKDSDIDESVLSAKLAEAGYTLDQYKEQLRESLAISKLIYEELDLNVSVSESEVKDFIDDNRDDFADLIEEGGAEFEEMLNARVKQKLMTDKQEEIINNYIESLKEDAQIS